MNILKFFNEKSFVSISSVSGMGKTMVAENIAIEAIREGYNVVYVSFTENTKKIYQDLNLINKKYEDQIDDPSIIEVQLTDFSKIRVMDNEYCATWSEHDNFIEHIYKKCEDNKTIIIIDQLENMDINESYYRKIVLGKIVRNLHRQNILSETSTVLLTDLSESVFKSASHRPHLKDLTDDGTLARTADQVLFMHRRSYYDTNDKPNHMEIFSGKNRFGKAIMESFKIDLEMKKISDNYPPTRSFLDTL